MDNTNYSVNCTITGYVKVELGDKRLWETDGNVVVNLDRLEDKEFNNLYYSRLRDILINNNKHLYLILSGYESVDYIIPDNSKTLCRLMANFCNYNVYKVTNISELTADYMVTVSKRNPTIEEMEKYIGGEFAAYGDMSSCLNKITELIKSNDIDGLVDFVDKRYETLIEFPSTIEYIKKLADMRHSLELVNTLSKKEEQFNILKDQNNELINEVNGLKDQVRGTSIITSSNNGTIIKNISTLDTSLFKCTTEHVLYFKEVSYVKYTNTLVSMLAEFLAYAKKRYKLVIFDNNCFPEVYKPLPCLDSSDFERNKMNYMAQNNKLVFVEPNPGILQTMLSSTHNRFDTIIVYDRLKMKEDIVKGNNVTKYFVINSCKDYENTKEVLNITNTSRIITRGKTTIGVDTLNIPDIPDFGGSKHKEKDLSDTAKKSKYNQLVTVNTGKPLIQTIAKESRILE